MTERKERNKPTRAVKAGKAVKPERSAKPTKAIKPAKHSIPNRRIKANSDAQIRKRKLSDEAYDRGFNDGYSKGLEDCGLDESG